MLEKSLDSEKVVDDNSKQQSGSKKASNGMLGGMFLAIILGICACLIYKFYEFVIGKLYFGL